MPISVALCTCNGERYLAEQLESLLVQDHRAIDLVVCDDASSDSTWELLQAYAPRFHRCRLVRNTTRLGVNRNFQQALSLCEGEWIAPCDQDDIWAPQKLSRLMAAAGEPHALLVYCDSQLVDDRGRSMGKRVSDRLHMLSGAHPLAFAIGNCVSGHATLLHRSLLSRALPIPAGIYYDEWVAFVASSIGEIRYVDEPLVQFRQHEHNLTGFASTGDGQRRSPLDVHAKAQLKLSAVASLDVPGPAQAVVAKLHRLWQRRERQWFSPVLAALMYRHHHALTMTDPGLNRKPAWQYAAKFAWGLRLKMVVWRIRQRIRAGRAGS